jgi:two-component system OmpR family response regulator
MVLLVDDNHDLATFLTVVMRDRGWNVVAAENARDARTAAQEHGFAAAIVDYMLPDDNGVYLALELRKTIPTLELLVVMTGGNLSNDDAAVCEAANMSVLQKPFAPQVLLSLLRDRVRPSPLSNSAGAS